MILLDTNVLDIRLVAAMQRYGISRLLTFNVTHFRAMPVTILDPASVLRENWRGFDHSNTTTNGGKGRSSPPFTSSPLAAVPPAAS
jgi:hypothetical protein